MGCCAPNAVGAGPETADPCKRVNYTLGMLLGVDDFVQEAAYHNGRRRELARELLGYGTVHGLQVVVEPDGDRGPRVRVMPGMAWLPSGTPVCVDSPQCANLDDWLTAHAADLAITSPAGRLPLYVVLSHAECLTDNVPIPGEPCRDDSELMQASRVADGFRLELRLAPPPQVEEDALRDFVAWLLDLPLAPSSPPLDEQAFADRVREAAHAWLSPGSPPTSPPDFMLGSAPAGTSEALFDVALRLWTTELRPLWMARADCSCRAEPFAPRDGVVLLAELSLDLVNGGTGWAVREGDVRDVASCDESRRPFVLSLRMVQELITRHPVPDPGDSVQGETAFGQAAFAGHSLHFSRADHTHGTPTLPSLGGDLSGPLADAQVESLQGVPLALGSPLVEGNVLTLKSGHWVPSAPAVPTVPSLAGDVGGAFGTNTIGKLQGKKLSASAPLKGQYLRYTGTQWVPDSIDNRDAPFVGRGTSLPYEIIAAAEVANLAATGSKRLAHRYGDIDITSVKTDATHKDWLLVTMRVSVADAAKYTGYIVKLTPMWNAKIPFGYTVYLAEPVTVKDSGVTFIVLLRGEKPFAETPLEPFRFQVELSRFGEAA